MKAKEQQDQLRMKLIAAEDGNTRTDFYLNGEYTDEPVTLFFAEKGEWVTATVGGKRIEDVRVNVSEAV
jgi:hypothetical protein